MRMRSVGNGFRKSSIFLTLRRWAMIAVLGARATLGGTAPRATAGSSTTLLRVSSKQKEGTVPGRSRVRSMSFVCMEILWTHGCSEVGVWKRGGTMHGISVRGNARVGNTNTVRCFHLLSKVVTVIAAGTAVVFHATLGTWSRTAWS